MNKKQDFIKAHDILFGWMDSNKEFSAYEVTKELRSGTTQNIPHDTVRGFVHYFMEFVAPQTHSYGKDWDSEHTYIVYKPVKRPSKPTSSNLDVKINLTPTFVQALDPNGCCQNSKPVDNQPKAKYRDFKVGTKVLFRGNTNFIGTITQTYPDDCDVDWVDETGQKIQTRPYYASLTLYTESKMRHPVKSNLVLLDTRKVTYDKRVYLSSAVLKTLLNSQCASPAEVFTDHNTDGHTIVRLKSLGKASSRVVDQYGSAKVPAPAFNGKGQQIVEIWHDKDNHQLIIV